MKATVSPDKVVVLPEETSTPELRSTLRERGFFVPPSLARESDGDVMKREANAPQPPAQQQREGFAFQGDHNAPPEAYDAPTNDFGAGGSGPEAGTPTGAMGSVGGEGSAPPPPQPSQNQSQQNMEPATMQIDYRQAAAMADDLNKGGQGGGGGGQGAGQGAPPPPEPISSANMSAVGESTTQASHRIERLDLSDWGYLLRIVMIAEEKDPEPTNALNNLRPTIGQWLQNEISQPGRLEYDRRFRRDIEKQLAKFLTQQISRFPVIKADIQFIE